MCLVLSPPCTLKLSESEPGLEPRCPLHLPLSEVQADNRTGDTILPGFPGVLLQDRFAISWQRVRTWLCAYQPSLAPTGVSSGRKRRQAGRELQCAPADPRPSAPGLGCSVRSALRRPWLWWKLLPCAQTVPTGCEGQSCLATPALPALLWEVGSMSSDRASTEHANILYHIRLTGKTGKTNL